MFKTNFLDATKFGGALPPSAPHGYGPLPTLDRTSSYATGARP